MDVKSMDDIQCFMKLVYNMMNAIDNVLCSNKTIEQGLSDFHGFKYEMKKIIDSRENSLQHRLE